MEIFNFDNASRKTFKTRDDAFVSYVDVGAGEPILLLHGWGCSNRVWKKNLLSLAEQYRVIAMDFRGHGASSKVLHGHTVPHYANDVRELIDQLNLQDVTLVGWSMAVPILLAYYEQYLDNLKLKTICFIDGTPAPFVDESWNYHRMKSNNGDTNSMNQEIIDYVNNPVGYLTPKVQTWFTNPKEDVSWLINEILKAPPWIAYAIYTDFLHRNYVATLKKIALPALAFVPTNSAAKIATGQFIADNIPQGRLEKIAAGHLLFYEQAETFNRKLSEFIKDH